MKVHERAARGRIRLAICGCASFDSRCMASCYAELALASMHNKAPNLRWDASANLINLIAADIDPRIPVPHTSSGTCRMPAKPYRVRTRSASSSTPERENAPVVDRLPRRPCYPTRKAAWNDIRGQIEHVVRGVTESSE